MGYYSGTIQKGSQGNDVKKWQEFLNSQGYNLTADGIFGDNTLSATTEWQGKNGLSVDGIVGKNTWGKAGFTNINTPVSAPTLPEMPGQPTYVTNPWDTSTKGSAALGAYNTAKVDVDGYTKAEWADEDKYKNLIQEYENRPNFTYDLNGDALYQQYKDKFTQQGKLAMADTMGQASAMTGGYGNSYAATVGNQAYQAHLDKLNDIVPELYQLAYNKDRDERQDLLKNIDLLRGERDYHDASEADRYNKLLDSLGIAKDDYYRGADMHYAEESNANDVKSKAFSDAMAIWENNANNAWKQAEWDESVRRYDQQMSPASSSGSSGGGSSSGGSSGGSGGGSSGGSSGGGGSIPSSVEKKASEFTSNTALGNYLDGLEASGAITPSQAEQLYAQYADQNEKYTDDGKSVSYKSMVGSTNGWKVIDDGGINWFWGIDNNAIVESPNGERIRLDDLVDRLVSEGMSKADAKNAVKKLQKNLGE